MYSVKFSWLHGGIFHLLSLSLLWKPAQQDSAAWSRVQVQRARSCGFSSKLPLNGCPVIPASLYHPLPRPAPACRVWAPLGFQLCIWALGSQYRLVVLSAFLISSVPVWSEPRKLHISKKSSLTLTSGMSLHNTTALGQKKKDTTIPTARRSQREVVTPNSPPGSESLKCF